MAGHRIFSALVLAVVAFCVPQRAFAVPLLQLEIKDGKYNPATQTTTATTNAFTLYAYLTPGTRTPAAKLQAMLNDTYYIGAALTPKVSKTSDLGSFSFNGTTVNATSDMVYGAPPSGQFLGGADKDSGDLSKGGVYNTYFKEFEFTFKKGPTSAAANCAVNVNCASKYDVQTASPATGDMYYVAFTVDTSELSPQYDVRFDLYNKDVRNGDLAINKFSPSSARSRFRNDLAPVPEPGSLVLFGTGAAVLAAAAYRRRRRQ